MDKSTAGVISASSDVQFVLHIDFNQEADMIHHGVRGIQTDSYAFLLRVPSEALPVQVGSGGLHDGKLGADRHSRLWCESGVLTLQLA